MTRFKNALKWKKSNQVYIFNKNFGTGWRRRDLGAPPCQLLVSLWLKFSRGAEVVKLLNPPPPRTIFAFTHALFKDAFGKIPQWPPPPHFKHLSLLPPPHPPPLPLKNFNLTLKYRPPPLQDSIAVKLLTAWSSVGIPLSTFTQTNDVTQSDNLNIWTLMI